MASSDAQSTATWQFLNSSFGLWLFSAIFITGAGTAFTWYQGLKADERKRVETVEKLDLEIAFRYFQAMNHLWALSNKNVNDIKLAEGRRAQEIERVLASLNERQPQNLLPLYAEFSAFSLPTLHAELRRHLSGSQQRQVDASLAKLTGGVFEDLDLSDLKAVGAKVQTELLSGRWKNKYFFWVDCPPSKPWC
jgi:hypothetical protein